MNATSAFFIFPIKHFIPALQLWGLLVCCLPVAAQPQDWGITRADSILYRLYHPSEEHVMVVSHRGSWQYAPENSLAAIQHCIHMGVDVVEIDVRLTRDGHLVAIHDLTLDRTTNGKGKVSDFTLEEIKKLRLKNAIGVKGSLHSVPTLEEVMNLAKGKIMVNLDKTEGQTVREAYEVLVRTGTVNHAIYKGNDPIEVMRARYGTLMDSIIYVPKVWYDLADIPGYVKAYHEAIHPPAYEMLFNDTNSNVFQQIPKMNQLGVTVLAIALWDELCAGRTDEKALLEGPESAWGWLVAQGANAIMTDAPELLIAYLHSKGLHP